MQSSPPRTIVHKHDNGAFTWVTVIEYPNTTTLFFYEVDPLTSDLQQKDIPEGWNVIGESTMTPLEKIGNPSVFTIPIKRRKHENHVLMDELGNTIMILLIV